MSKRDATDLYAHPFSGCLTEADAEWHGVSGGKRDEDF